MAEARMVQHAERSPSACVACGTNKGPFIDLDVSIFKLPTATGMMDVDGALYLCIGTPANPGCVVQIARKTGLMIDVELYEEKREEIDHLSQRIADLEALMTKKTIRLEDAQKLFGGVVAA